MILLSQDNGFQKFIGLHASPPMKIVNYLEQTNVEKSLWYFDEQNQKDGKFFLYPYLQLDSIHYLVQTPSIGKNKRHYNYILLLEVDTEVTSIDTLGPYFDSFVVGAKIKSTENQERQTITLQLWSEPAPGEEPDSFLELNGHRWRFESHITK